MKNTALLSVALVAVSFSAPAAEARSGRCPGLFVYAIVNGEEQPRPADGDKVWVTSSDKVVLEARWSSGTCPDFDAVQWYRNDTTIAGADKISGFQATRCVVSKPGLYRLKHQSGSLSGELEVFVQTGTAHHGTPESPVQSLFRMRVYPQTVQQDLTVEGNPGEGNPVTLHVLSQQGRTLRTERHTAASAYFRQTLRLTDLKPGVYYLLIECQDQKRVQRFVKE